MRWARTRSRSRDVDLAQVRPVCGDGVAFGGGKRAGVGLAGVACGEGLAGALVAGLPPVDAPAAAWERW
jgi:hypothetical protein